ncbi:helix-turn-helix domain-containing protein [Nocardia alni]|uniref:helix-turn-helix domain-containing protein n=1 Tax=Nocardia alni TaxID=2815723 RepID=UPI001C2205C1|nr:helix-turn-helix transcriptional regulator [Nocardia alni]
MNDDFGATLRGFRARVKPETVGIRPALPATRRVPGLRRDELARLAGVSEEHLKRLEQGRRRPSRAVVDALAKALRLDRAEYSQLCLLVGFAVPDVQRPARAARVPREITPPAQRLLDRLTDVPTCVCDASWTVLAGNRSWTEAKCGGDAPGRYERNIAWRLFGDAPTNVVRSPEYLTGFKSSVVADLRAALQRYPADPRLRDLVTDLRTESGEFARLWSSADTGGYHPDRITIRHPDRAPVLLDKDVMTIEPGDLRVVVFTTPLPPRAPCRNAISG